MKSRKPQPASRRRYAEQNPTIGVHVPREVRDRLVELSRRSGLSVGKLVQQVLGVAEKDVESIRDQCRKEFYPEGWRACWKELAGLVKQYRLTFPCCKCGGPIPVEVDSEVAEAVVAFLTERRWGHRECPEPQG